MLICQMEKGLVEYPENEKDQSEAATLTVDIRIFPSSLLRAISSVVCAICAGEHNSTELLFLICMVNSDV